MANAWSVPLEQRERRDDVEHRRAFDRAGVVERHPPRHPPAAVVARHAEAVEAERGHRRDHVRGHRPLAVAGVVVAAGRLAAVAVAAQVGADHGEALARAPAPPGASTPVSGGSRAAAAAAGRRRRSRRRWSTSPTSISPVLEPVGSTAGSCQSRARGFPDRRRSSYDRWRMSSDPAYLAAPPPLTGRAAALDDLVALAATRPGVVVVAGPPGIGRSRLVREAAARLAMDGTALVDAEAPGPGGGGPGRGARRRRARCRPRPRRPPAPHRHPAGRARRRAGPGRRPGTAARRLPGPGADDRPRDGRRRPDHGAAPPGPRGRPGARARRGARRCPRRPRRRWPRSATASPGG